MHRRNVFAGPYIDRLGHLRQDEEWLASVMADTRTRAIPVWKSQNLITAGEAPRAGFVELSALGDAGPHREELILLGRYGDAHYFAYEVESEDPPALLRDAHFQDLRQAASSLSAEDAGILAYARAMISWRRHHQFCGKCGAETRPAKGGHVLRCTRDACGHEQFPRLDPAIIVLVSDADRALLGRQAAWPKGRYSTIAGFVEPGESLEDAVTREVAEETGIEVDNVQYHSSQPWPFPSSLMLGFTARARSHAIHLRDEELEDARWFSVAEIKAGHPLLPPNQSISFSLIEHWFDSFGEGRLRDIAGTLSWPTPR